MNHNMESLCTDLLSHCMCNRDSVNYMLLAVCVKPIFYLLPVVMFTVFSVVVASMVCDPST